MRLSVKAVWQVLVVVGVLWGAQNGSAQTPAGSTGQCNDGSYTSAAKKWQACRGHQGVKSWFAEAGQAAPASAAAPAMAAKPAGNAPTPAQAAAPATPASAPAAAAATSSGGKRLSPAQRAASTPQAAGGGGGKVWVNTETKVYHCEGTTFYGKTKAGQYMTEAEAKAAGARPDRNKPCSK